MWPAPFRHELHTTIALLWRGAGARRHGYGSLGATRSDLAVHAVLITGTAGRKRDDRAGHPVEQWAGQGGIIPLIPVVTGCIPSRWPEVTAST